MLTKTLSEAKKKQRNILIKAMNNDIGSIDSAKDSWNPAQISERSKDISYIRSLVDSWNPAQLNEALKMFDLPIIDTWNPAQIEEQRRNLLFYLTERTLTGNPITLKILGNLTPEVTGLKVTMNPIQDLHGYSHPWAGGAGKNLADKATKLPSEITVTVDNDGKMTLNGTTNEIIYIRGAFNCPDKTATYTWALFNDKSNNDVQFSVRQRDDNIAGGWARVDAVNKTFTFTPEATPAKWQMQINRGVTLNNFVIAPMIVSGNIAPTTFEPYSNICPISGRTEASVTRTAGEDVETKTHEYNETIWWATDDFKNGGMEAIGAEIASYDGETLPGEWISDRDVYAPDTTPTTGAQVVYKNTPTTVETTAEEITLLKGTNVLSTDGDSIELKYKQNF